MLEMNKVLLIGNLTRDPELSYLTSGTALAKMGLAVNRRFKDRNGEWKDETAFVDIEAWGKTAEFCSQYLKKGRRVFLEGRLKFDQWEDKASGAKRSRLSVVAERIQFADSKPGGRDAGDGGNYPSQASSPSGGTHAEEFPPDVESDDSTADDLPF